MVPGYLDQPLAPLPHLTRLLLTDINDLHPEDSDATPLRRLAAAAPRLEVLEWRGGGAGDSIACAVEGHPCLKELWVYDDEDAWLRAIPRLPALATLRMHMNPPWDGCDDDWDRAGGETARALRVCASLACCQRLSHLNLTFSLDVPARELLSAVGAAVGSRLLSLILGCALLERGAAARAAYALLACYPCLEVLELSMPFSMEASVANALSRELLLAAISLAAPLCPALRKVRCDRGGTQTGLWLRPTS